MFSFGERSIGSAGLGVIELPLLREVIAMVFVLAVRVEVFKLNMISLFIPQTTQVTVSECVMWLYDP
ncbi:hypothetical protein CEXT_805671 [Caerostris extrusa]|uniref:Uncharacterized protein n=1 Tax=Caerostris extrusa TaxID=172846 RepID=A0AAV4WG15_CAEEX|nr:hypothetical protein CEXT_805671 [Caerostris extrusa]